jgi:integrase
VYPRCYPHGPVRSRRAIRQAQGKALQALGWWGLHILVQPNGGKLWRLKYRINGREKLISFGPYPATALADARRRRDQAKSLLVNGADPSVQRKNEKVAAAVAANNTFGALASELLGTMESDGAASTTLNKNRWLLENLAAPLKNRPIAEITSAEILDLLKRIEKSGRRETARRIRGMIGSVFRLAVVTLRASTDPTFALRGSLSAPKVTPRAAITDEQQLGRLMLSIDEYDGWPTLTSALKFTALTCARPGEARGAKRKEFNLEKATWQIPAERTKMRRPHDVPLSSQAVAVMRDIWDQSEYGELVFPSSALTGDLYLKTP